MLLNHSLDAHSTHNPANITFSLIIVLLAGSVCIAISVFVVLETWCSDNVYLVSVAASRVAVGSVTPVISLFPTAKAPDIVYPDYVSVGAPSVST